ncbi:serine hydrolase domain-containing protein [Spirosoma endophyticum]|uniref:CubicO group peptidase, beta-lactamase class C family n=1 Tax=Spirosoma endophyticum TaxID=662367 RepID=A0A1I1S8G6_9BACT|nr:serine hydrolase domain-containing protein [Spirosoma endophyticum]SFD42804.1 CubicO group peptidase, beta-lactamase class C family [Spirosoma endophyticum]
MLKRLFSLLTPLWLLMAWLDASAQHAAAALPVDKLSFQIDSLQKAHHIPGLQVLIFTKDSLLYQRNAGLRNLKTKTPVTAQTLFPVASITKSLVAVATLMLVQQGKLALTDEVKKLVPDIPIDNPWQTTDPVRIAYLLEHTAGFDDWSMKAYAYNNPTISLQEGFTIDPQARRTRWRPGTFMAYSNAAPPVVARIIETKTGHEFESFVRQRIFTPLGMKRATFHRDGAALTDLATGYVGKDQQEAPYWYLLARPSGGLNISALELMPFVQMLMGRGSFQGQQLLSPALVDRMETPTTSLANRAGSQQGYGLHNFITAYQGHLLHGHDGAGIGLRAHYLYQSGLNRGIIFLINTDGPAFFKLRDAILKLVLQDIPAQLPPEYPLSAAQKQTWLGYYRPSHFRIAKTGWFLGLTDLLRISEEEGKLVFYDGLGSNPVRLRPIGAHRALRLEKQGYTPELTLVQDDRHEAVLVRAFGAGIQANTATKTSALGAWLPVALGHVCLLIIGLCVLLGFGWLGRGVWLWRKGRRLSALPVRISLFVYGLSYVVMLILLNGEGNHLGVVSPQSMTVFVTSVLGPLAALGALASLLGRYKQISGRFDWLFMSVATSSAMVVVGYLGVWGLIGFQTWA